MRSLVLTPKFRRAYRRFVRRNDALQGRIEDALRQMEIDVFAPNLGAHKLSGDLFGFWRVPVGMTVALYFQWSKT